jgi:hypothetical protein
MYNSYGVKIIEFVNKKLVAKKAFNVDLNTNMVSTIATTLFCRDGFRFEIQDTYLCFTRKRHKSKELHGLVIAYDYFGKCIRNRIEIPEWVNQDEVIYREIEKKDEIEEGCKPKVEVVRNRPVRSSYSGRRSVTELDNACSEIQWGNIGASLTRAERSLESMSEASRRFCNSIEDREENRVSEEAPQPYPLQMPHVSYDRSQAYAQAQADWMARGSGLIDYNRDYNRNDYDLEGRIRREMERERPEIQLGPPNELLPDSVPVYVDITPRLPSIFRERQ